MRILILIALSLLASTAVSAQTKENKKALGLELASTGFTIAGTLYDWKQANKYAGTLQGNTPASAVFKCEGNALYRSGKCYQSDLKYWGINGGVIAVTSLLKYKFATRWHLFGDTIDIGFGAMHFLSGRRWNTNLSVIGHYPR